MTLGKKHLADKWQLFPAAHAVPYLSFPPTGFPGFEDGLGKQKKPGEGKLVDVVGEGKAGVFIFPFSLCHYVIGCW